MNRVKLFIFTAIFIALVFTFSGCAVFFPPVTLSKGIPERFFSDAKIDIDDSKKVSYTFKSKIEDPFKYNNRNDVDLNSSYKSVLKNYMNHKYTLVDKEEGNYHIDVMLVECTSEAADAGMEKAYGYSSTGASVSATVYNIKVTTELTVKVRVNVDGKESEKKIEGMGEFTGNSSDAGTVSRSFDLAIRATISQIDRFLNNALN